MSGKVDRTEEQLQADSIKKQFAAQAAETYAKAIDIGLRRLIKDALGLAVPASTDLAEIKAFVDGHGLTIIATPPSVPTKFVLVQHGKEIGTFDVVDWFSGGKS